MTATLKIVLSLFVLAVCAPQVSLGENLVIRFLDRFLLTVVHKLFNQRPANQNGTFAKYETYAINDQTNEEIATANIQEIIVRSGYKYENHYVLSADGYVTQLVRVVNPLADRKRLKQPPVMLFHGCIINPTAYICASSIQHHPEKYPQVIGNSHTSWNRSLAFTLSNNGYDVWLVGSRGASKQNQGHKKYKVYSPKGILGKDEDAKRKTTITDEFVELAQTFHYWDFTFDEVVEYDVPAQVNTVLKLTGAANITFFSFSCSTVTALSALSSNRDLSRKVHNLVLMAPIINYKGVNRLMSFIKDMCLALDFKLGTLIYSGILTTQPIRDLILSIANSRDLRYSVIKAVLNFIAGSSAKFFTNLEGPVLGHVFEPTSFKQCQHMFQMVDKERMQKYDFGKAKNLEKYGTEKPPVHDISNLGVRKWALVTADNDNLAPPGSSQQVLDQVIIQPEVIINYPAANHLDLIAGFENDVNVNLPLLKWLNRNSLPPLRVKVKLQPEYFEKQVELEGLIPVETNDEPVDVVEVSSRSLPPKKV